MYATKLLIWHNIELSNHGDYNVSNERLKLMFQVITNWSFQIFENHFLNYYRIWIVKRWCFLLNVQLLLKYSKVSSENCQRTLSNLMESELLKASKDGNIKTIKQILKTGSVFINCKDVWSQNFSYHFDIIISYYFFKIILFWNLIKILNNTPLINASENGYTEIVQLLLSLPGIQINCRNISIELSFMPFILNHFIIFWFMNIFLIFYFHV